MSWSDTCVLCGRKRVVMIYVVQGTEYRFPYRGSFAPEEHGMVQVKRDPQNAEYMRRRPLKQRRGRPVCLDRRDCLAVRDRKRKKQAQRSKLPEDAALKKLHKARRGWCKWCGEMVYRRRAADGAVVQDKTRMWHIGRIVHPDADPEPQCVQAYNAQAFTFRTQVFARDRGVCACCGRDCEAEREAWRARNPHTTWDADGAEDWYARPFEERDAEHRRWLAEEPPGWEADHVLALEDGGEHAMVNAQTLCKGCHIAKTSAENSARARR